MGSNADKEKQTGNIFVLLAIGNNYVHIYNVGCQGPSAERASNGCYAPMFPSQIGVYMLDNKGRNLNLLYS
jgi:hypothetical protein